VLNELRAAKFGLLGLTYDDVLLVPSYSQVEPKDVSTSTRVTRTIELNIPIVSSPMDTVTEARLAIALAREGGIGVIHRNMSIEAQADEVDKVKRSESGMIVDPITLHPGDPLTRALDVMEKYHISGVPITDEGGRLVGILTNRDIRFCDDLTRPVGELMTSENLITVPVGTTLEEAKAVLHRHRIEKLPVVDDQFRLRGLITVKDIQKKQRFPNATKDERGRLRVGAAVGVGKDSEDRVAALLDAEVDLIVVDVAHGHTSGVIETVRRIKRASSVQVVAGQVISAEAVMDLVDAGADGLRVG
jgi:IMP dehydrogenase